MIAKLPTLNRILGEIHPTKTQRVQIHFYNFTLSPRKHKSTPRENYQRQNFPHKVSPRKNGNLLPAKITKWNILPAKILRAKCLPAKTEINSPRKLSTEKLSPQSVSPQKWKSTPHKNYPREVYPRKNSSCKVSPRENRNQLPAKIIQAKKNARMR